MTQPQPAPTFPLPNGTGASVTLNGSGVGTANLGPSRVREKWWPSIISVTVTTNVSEPTCKVYIGPTPTAINFVDGTYTGSNDSTDSCQGSVLHVGDQVWAVWTGGDAGAVATVTVSGTYQVGSS